MKPILVTFLPKRLFRPLTLLILLWFGTPHYHTSCHDSYHYLGSCLNACHYGLQHPFEPSSFHPLGHTLIISTSPFVTSQLITFTQIILPHLRFTLAIITP